MTYWLSCEHALIRLFHLSAYMCLIGVWVGKNQVITMKIHVEKIFDYVFKFYQLLHIQ